MPSLPIKVRWVLARRPGLVGKGALGDEEPDVDALAELCAASMRARSSTGGGRLAVLAFIEKLTAVRAILDHVGLPSTPLPLGKARGPPQAAWDF